MTNTKQAANDKRVNAGLVDYFSNSKLTPMRVIGKDDRTEVNLLNNVKHFENLGGRDFGSEKWIGDDDRVEIPDIERKLHPWIKICRLQVVGPVGSRIDIPYIGTGWFAGPRTIITAGHVLYDSDWRGWDKSPAWAQSIDVGIGYHRSVSFAHMVATRFYVADAWKDFIDRGGSSEDSATQIDVGCIQLDADLWSNSSFLTPFIAGGSNLEQQPVTASGYPDDRDNGEVMYTGSGAVSGVETATLYHTADTYGGESGSPLWLGGKDERQPKIVGIHTGGETNVKNWATRITEDVAGLINGWVQANS